MSLCLQCYLAKISLALAFVTNKSNRDPDEKTEGFNIYIEMREKRLICKQNGNHVVKSTRLISSIQTHDTHTQRTVYMSKWDKIEKRIVT